MNALSRWIRTTQHARRLIAESAFYRKRCESEGIKIPNETDIRQRLKSQWNGKQASSTGAIRSLAIFHDHNWEGSSLLPALGAFGEVTHVDWKNSSDANLSLEEAHRARHLRLAQSLQSMSLTHPPDVIFTYLSGEQVAPITLQLLRTMGVPLVNLSLNDKESFVGAKRKKIVLGMRDICHHFDLCWTSTLDALPKYAAEGATPLYLPEGANPQVHKPYGIVRDIDVCFVGQCYGERPRIIDRLRRMGIRVHAIGPGWPSGSVTTEEMVRTWSRSRIVLGFSGVLGHRQTFCLKGRDFEVPMSGNCYLTEYHHELELVYKIGLEIEMYVGFDHLVERILWLLAHPDAAEGIRNAGRLRALRDHTWEVRFEKIFGLLGLINNQDHADFTQQPAIQ